MKLKTSLYFVIIICTVLLVSCSSPTATKGEYVIVNPLQEPSQGLLDNIEPKVIKYNNDNFLITPQAKYSLSARVVSVKKYHFGWTAHLAPYDFALAWGELSKPESFKYIKYSQGGRWYRFRYKNNCPYSKEYIYKHSANTHMIPANENIRKALGIVEKSTLVYIEGYLVKVNATLNGRNVWWNSSLTRLDTGDNSCEVFYVEKIAVNGKVYN